MVNLDNETMTFVIEGCWLSIVDCLWVMSAMVSLLWSM
jgi:hypothetical protein